MDQLPVEIKIDDLRNPQLHALLIFNYTSPIHYMSVGLARSFSHRDVSMINWENCILFL